MFQLAQYCLIAATILVGLGIGATTLNLTRRPEQREEIVPVRASLGHASTRGGVATATPVQSAVRENTGPGWTRYATVVTFLAFIALTISLAASALHTGHGPFTNQHEFTVSFGWGIVAAYLAFEWRYKVKALAIVVLPFAFVLLLVALLIDAKPGPLVPALQNSPLLTAHVFTAVLAYGAAAVACAAGVLYLVAPSFRWRGMPKQSFLDEMGYRAVMVAFPMMTVMIILGAVWADVAWGKYWSWDPKETAALVTWLIYGAYLHARVARGWRGDRAAWLLILGMVAILFTFFGNYFLGGMHSYGGAA